MSHTFTKRQLFNKWFLTVTLGEFIGFIIPSIAGVATAYAHVPQLVQTFVLVLAGMGEGAVLGYAQSRVISRIVPRIKQPEWIRATVLGAGIAWLMGMTPSTLYDYREILPLSILILIGGVLLAVLLLSMGYLQYLVLRKHVAKASGWIWINILAWVVGLVVLFLFMGIAPEGFGTTLLFSILGGLGMAASMAAITGLFVVKMRKE